MLILAVDTSHRNGSVSLLRDELVLAIAEVEGGLFSAQLVPRIAELLQGTGIQKQEIEAYAVAVGPGSFTGLRIGLAAIKGLAEVMPRPIAAVSVLEAIAFAGARSTSETRLIAAMDASRREVYLGQFESESESLRSIRETLCPEAELPEFLQDLGEACVITPEERIAALVQAAPNQVKTQLIPWPGSAVVGMLGLRKLRRGQSVSVDELDANYVRRDENLFFRSGTPHP